MAHKFHEHVHSPLEQVNVEHVLLLFIESMASTERAAEVVASRALCPASVSPAYSCGSTIGALVFVYVDVELEHVLPQEFLDHLILVSASQRILNCSTVFWSIHEHCSFKVGNAVIVDPSATLHLKVLGDELPLHV